MCGIIGWVDWERDLTTQQPALATMDAALTHRASIAGQLWQSPRCALGHRPLVVNHSSGALQPFVERMGSHTYVITCDGYLANCRELRADLIARGHRFRTLSDAELVLRAYFEWGTAAVERLLGAFAFGLWDEAAQRLFMARDHFGVKPLYYTTRGSAFLFASQLRGLLAHPEVEPVVDGEGLAELLYLPTAQTPGHGIFRGIHALRPGHWLIHDREGTRTAAYWKLESHPHEATVEQTAEQVRELLQQAISQQMVTDLPLGTMLSGGLDSSAVTAFAADVCHSEGLGTLHSWSMAYREVAVASATQAEEQAADGPFARQVADFLGTVHQVIQIESPALVEALGSATLARDLPGLGQFDSSLHLFCRAVQPQTSLLLSGDCGDGLFGEPSTWSEPPHPSSQPPRLPPWVTLLRPGVTGSIRAADYVAQRYADAQARVPRLPSEGAVERRQRERAHIYLTWLTPALLDRGDRMAAAAGVELRFPFCDPRLVQYLWNVPGSMKRLDGQEKGLLRLALHGILPEEVRLRPKQPYPTIRDPHYYRATQSWVRQILEDPGARLHELLDAQAVQQLSQQEGAAFHRGGSQGGLELFAFLGQLETWLRRYRVRLL